MMNENMKNERITEGIVRKDLDKAGIIAGAGFAIEEQKSANPRIEKLLKSASKSGDGVGKPEFLITKNGEADFIILIECKADTKYHASASLDQYKDYAVDGALLYAGHLSREYDVIAIGVSGQSEKDLLVSTYLYPKGATSPSVLSDENGAPIASILSWDRYLARATFDPARAAARHADLMKFSRELHNYMRDYAKITEAQKPLLVSGVLIALMDKGFEKAYSAYEGPELAQKTFRAIRDGIGKAQLGENQEVKKRAVINAFSFIEHHPELSKFDPKKNESPLIRIVRDLHAHVQPFMKDHPDFDVIGSFYAEFIRYTGGDGKGLGIVLTPKHITDLFADLAKLNKNSVVLDICCGTGGFLISAMKKMTEGVSEDEKRHILEHSLIGIEQEPQMFALAVSNMMLRGDGKTNLYQGSCFDDALFGKVAGKASAGFINPPYSQKGDELHEWNFVLRMLDGLGKNATGIVIVPMSLVIAPHPLRERVLKEHRLEAVMSMPDDLFYPVGVVTCIMVFTAHVPHESDKHHESWFGYWKDDGFRKDRIRGRIPDTEESWRNKKEQWLSDYTNRKVSAGHSVRKKVTAQDEWSAEAYLETDYTSLTVHDFVQRGLAFGSYKMNIGDFTFVKEMLASPGIAPQLRTDTWQWFVVDDLFEISGSKTTPKKQLQESGAGPYPYVTTQSTNNGVEGFYNICTERGNAMVIDSAVKGFCSYQPDDFSASDHVEKLIPKFSLNKYVGLFLQTIINQEQFRYSYGKKFNQEKIRATKIKLPVDNEGKPDWKFMEDYIKSLPYSSGIV